MLIEPRIEGYYLPRGGEPVSLLTNPGRDPGCQGEAATVRSGKKELRGSVAMLTNIECGALHQPDLYRFWHGWYYQSQTRSSNTLQGTFVRVREMKDWLARP